MNIKISEMKLYANIEKLVKIARSAKPISKKLR